VKLVNWFRKKTAPIRKYIAIGSRFSFTFAPKPWFIYEVNPYNIALSIDFPTALRADSSLMNLGFSYGNWDKHSIKLDEDSRYQSLVAHFRDGLEWNKTSYFGELRKGLHRKAKWERFDSIQDILCSYDDLYETARQNPDLVFCVEDPILLLIDRNGNLLLRDGHHRVVIAQILGIEKIFAKVVGRHGKWLETRRKILQGNFSAEDFMDFSNHPDIKINAPKRQLKSLVIAKSYLLGKS
jgi:hypothetical protein